MASRLAVIAVCVCACRVRFDPVDGDAQPSGYREAVIADHAISYWRLDDTNAIARDELGIVDGGYIGTCAHGVAGALAGDPDTAAAFDGATCKINLGNNFAFAGTAAYSAEVWVKPMKALAYEHYITMQVRDVSGPLDGWALFRDNGPVGVMVERVIASTNVKTVPTEIVSGEWTHLVAVYDGAALFLYIDGVLASTAPDARPAAAFNSVAIIGAHSQGAYVTGSLDEVAIYDVPLDAAQVKHHYELGTR